MHDQDLRRQLASGAAALGVSLDAAQIEQFLHYLALLRAWNGRARLTAIVDPEDIVRLHFLDALLCLRAGIPAQTRLIDVGSGAGLPGVPLKIARPDLRISLLESTGRKAAFLEVVARELSLEVDVKNQRAELAGRDAQWRERFDVAAARAVAKTATLAELALPFVRPGGRVLLLKGPGVRGEMAGIQAPIERLGGGTPALLEEILPGGERRVIVSIPKVSATPALYPRRPGLPARRPLAAR